MKKILIDYYKPLPYSNDKFMDFLKAHNVEIDWPYESMRSIPFVYMLQIIKELGYSIEVAEISAADKAIGSIKGRNWHRCHQYRWSIIYWDEHGTMISLTYSDLCKQPLYNSEEDAIRNAINYIVDHYKELEC
jgi:hypothetical protein